MEIGQIIGIAENSTHDLNCIAPQVLDYEAVVWGPKMGEIHELPTFSGDSVAGAAAINDKGQVVGASGSCRMGPALGPLFIHGVLWQNGIPTDLGNLGGTVNNVALGINQLGQVVGSSDLPGDATFHAFLWQKGVMTDLGTLPGDFSSSAGDINDEDQVPIQSCDANGNCRAAIWQNGVMTDLNNLTAEYRDNLTPRAKASNLNWAESRQLIDAKDRPLADVERLVRLTIEQADTLEVGGPIDSAEIGSDGRICWFNHKESCPQNSN